MRIAVVGASVVASLVIAMFVAAMVPSVGLAQRNEPSLAKGGAGLVALAMPAGEQRQQVTVIDPETRVLGVYHIDLNTGEIVLKSVRNIHWDLQMVEFNGTSPLPREVRSLLEQK
jgi:hypothetical protein